MKKGRFLFPICLSLLLAACGSKTLAPTATPAPSPTADPCSAASLPGEVAKVNGLMREFDDLSLVAQNTPQSQLSQAIPPMQKVLREAEDQKVPACLAALKKLQLNHMNAVIQTLLVLLSNPQPGQDAINSINRGIAQARDFHQQYDLELARLLGVTLVPRPTSASKISPVTTPSAPTMQVLNSGTAGINLRGAPNLNAPTYAVLAAGETAIAVGRTNDDQWIQVQVPGHPELNAWVYAQLVQLSGTIDQLPIVTP